MEPIATEKPIINSQYSASQIADYFVFLDSQEMLDDGIPEGVSPLKLQKYLYFAQAASLALDNKKLFNEEIEAWKYGPVVSSVYQTYKDNGNTPITIPNGEYREIQDEETKEFITDMWKLLRRYSASELVAISHNHKPWRNHYHNGQRTNEVIPVDEIRTYYRNIFTRESDEDEQETKD